MTSALQAASPDIIARDRADRMAGALQRYGAARQAAMFAQLAFDASGDDAFRRSAEGHRADARAALHLYPDLLKMVERAEPSTNLVRRCLKCGNAVAHGDAHRNGREACWGPFAMVEPS